MAALLKNNEKKQRKRVDLQDSLAHLQHGDRELTGTPWGGVGRITEVETIL